MDCPADPLAFGVISAGPGGGVICPPLLGVSPVFGWGGGGGVLAEAFPAFGVELIVSKLFVSGCTAPQVPQKRVCGGSSDPQDTHLFTVFFPPK